MASTGDSLIVLHQRLDLRRRSQVAVAQVAMARLEPARELIEPKPFSRVKYEFNRMSNET
jgi:hypothetical protein